ncbi:MAG: Xylose isomerase domain protein barrel [Segetibacter sp.]|nr:Xylose isomerase domain protein barrel [Segetibacter sp.]
MKSEIKNASRRSFLKNTLLAGSLYPLMPGNLSAMYTRKAEPLKIHIFSKHLQFLNYQEMSEVAKEMGFDGIDLTVRPKGHVLPERVETDLPKAIEAMRKVGFTPLMMTTAIEDADNNMDKRVLEAAAKHGMKYYRMNWYDYPPGKSMPDALLYYQQKVKGLSLLNKKLGLIGCYQNHAGLRVGSSVWELWELIKEADKQSMGIQYDIRHATVEGGLSWQNGLRLLHPHIKTIPVKDFKWEKINGEWKVEGTPMGEGMVDFKAYFKLLKQYNINVPVSLHMEYPLGGAEDGATQLSVDKEVVFTAMKRDLQKVKELWQQA